MIADLVVMLPIGERKLGCDNWQVGPIGYASKYYVYVHKNIVDTVSTRYILFEETLFAGWLAVWS